ncbi:Hypothetical protein A7982_07700 [Minicystis rosea]|nr:Hypothetical protein A7982_07700 [Minicystis rosea]
MERVVDDRRAMSKGIDVVGWRGCAKQTELGPKRFLVTVKRLGRAAVLGRSLPPPSASQVAHTAEQRRRLQQHQEQRQAAMQFDQGTPECKECPFSDGRPYGCYTAIDFPIDAAAEATLFQYFIGQLDNDHSGGAALYRDLVSKAPPSGTPWHTDRGPGGMLAELETPLSKDWGFLLWKKHADSAQLLGTIFFNQRRLGLISALAEFWSGFVSYARENVPGFDESKTLRQIEALNDLYDRVMEIASHNEGIHVLVENDAPPLTGEKEEA